MGDPSLLLLYQEFVASKWLTNSSFVRDLESEKQMLAKRLYWDEALLVELAPLYQPPALIFGPGVHTRLRLPAFCTIHKFFEKTFFSLSRSTIWISMKPILLLCWWTFRLYKRRILKTQNQSRFLSRLSQASTSVPPRSMVLTPRNRISRSWKNYSYELYLERTAWQENCCHTEWNDVVYQLTVF